MRFFRLVVALALIPLVAAIVAATPAGGVQPSSAAPTVKPPKAIACQSMSMSTPSAPLVVSGCNRRGITGRSGTLRSCPIGICTSWATGKETDFTFSFSAPSTSRCLFPLAELDFVGKVVSASGGGTKRLIGATVSYDACFAQQINVVLVELVPGTQFTIG
jgi:hypothetical protein